MPKFQINASFQLDSVLEPEGVNLVHVFDFGDADDIEDNSYFRSMDVECEGGELQFKLDAEDEYEAERKAEEVISDGMEVTDDSNLTWVVSRVSFEVEAVEDEMTVERAKEIISTWLIAVPRTGQDGDLIPGEVRKALLFLLARVS